MISNHVSRETIRHEVRRDNGEVIATSSHYLHAKLAAESMFSLHRKVYPFLYLWTTYTVPVKRQVLMWANGKVVRT